MGSVLGLVAFAVVGGAGALWVKRMQAVRAGEVRSLVIGLMAAGAILSILAFVAGAGLAGGIAAGLALALSGTFLFLQPLSGQAKGTAAVAVGEPILGFVAPDDTGADFDLASLHGRPFLLKFFRGHW